MGFKICLLILFHIWGITYSTQNVIENHFGVKSLKDSFFLASRHGSLREETAGIMNTLRLDHDINITVTDLPLDQPMPGYEHYSTLSSCPWKYVITRDVNRIPSAMIEAKCLNANCQSVNTNHDLHCRTACHCQEVYRFVQVKRKSTSDGRRSQYSKVWERLAVGYNKTPKIMNMLYTFVLFLGILIQPINSKILDPKELIQSISSYKEACSAVGYERKLCSYRSKNNKMAVAFHAKMKNSQNNLKSNQKVLFEHVFLNIGSGYDAKTGVFTAPVDGIYRFDWTTLAAQKKYFITFLVKENAQISSNYCADIYDNEYGQCTSSAIVEMKANQKVWIKPYGGYAQGVTGSYSYFSGYII
ncbi:uncharacterized protein LOC134247990 [Saccostrea cucullata]|uniref:uncharacterized protein LOC134247990 n=1 Tax=Saccostrea cuccullata TaxID=36930 RepID=UPI002ED512E8